MEVQGTTTPPFVPVREVFEDVVDKQPGTGAALAVWHDGAWVVDVWGGYADAARTQAWERDSLVMPYSVAKPFAAVCALLLADRGSLDLDAPLSTYWPEMTAPTTMRQVLAHQSGHVVLDKPTPQEAFYDWDLICRLLAEQPPLWTPGTKHGEAALFYGHLIGEVVRRVDGRSLGRFLREEVCRPLDLDFHIGLREDELARVVELTGFDADFRRAGEEGSAMMARALANPPGALDPDVVNSHAWRVAEIPAVNGHGTARSVAGLYVALEQDQLLTTELRREVSSVASSGPDVVLGEEREWGLGVSIEPDGYGMGGVGGSFGWWSTEGRYAMAFLTGWIGDHDRGNRLEDAVRGCLGLQAL